MTLQDTNIDAFSPLRIAVPVAHDIIVADLPSGKRRIARALEDGRRFGRYQIVHLMAIGGMSEVYEAIHLGLHKRVALKVLHPELAENAEARERFLHEGIHAARIRHTHVVDVSDVGIVGELPFLVMELLAGEDLAVVYERQKRLPVSELIDWLLPIAAAVAVGHAKGVIHRDLKPDNIFMHREGRRVVPKVLDFGVSRATTARNITLNAKLFGTPHYMSPEQARGAVTDERTDQYSLGVMLYEGLTGRLPHDCANTLKLLHAVANDPFPPPSAFVELPPGLEDVILRAMASRREDRFPSMNDLALALVPFASEAARDYWELELLAAVTPEASGEVEHIGPAPGFATLSALDVVPARHHSHAPRSWRDPRELQWLALGGLLAVIGGTLILRALQRPSPYAAYIASSSARVQAAVAENEALAAGLQRLASRDPHVAPRSEAPEAASESSDAPKAAKPLARWKRPTTVATASIPDPPAMEAAPEAAPREEFLEGPRASTSPAKLPQPDVRILDVVREPRVQLVD